ncbi:unnamed protein product [Adineta steineri]|uniref:Uncharacterized protein n=1 Tax=Adineta steineri TaxID=433720 RepID=A0A818T5R9_9BILA|nr:unnamed protein product [Adineta steineri]CAF3680472.1 unnamed protein product [Adineta steineri]
MTDASQSPLVVVVSGGGPVGLTFSLNLVMMMGEHVKIIIYEGRWFVDEDSITRWQDEEQGKTRRDQVVTLQDHVIQQMPSYIQKGLFENYDERVWPTSRNIPIREVEDRLFALIEPFVQSGQIELVAEALQEQTERLIKGDFDMLIGADGSNSFVRRYCNIPMISEGVEYACGVAYQIPAHVPSSEEPLHQALNCVLTVAQTRYLVNSSSSRRGYLNIRLIQDEYEELRGRLQEFQHRNESLDLLDVNKCPNSSLVWTIVRQGLEFFKISPKYVFRVLPIEINVRHASIVVRELRFEIQEDKDEKVSSVPKAGGRKQYKTALACLAGDAALNVHFWPGRGMNSGMKAAMALARNIVRSCRTKASPETITIRRPLRFLDFLDYEGFMARLRAREQQGRSLRVLIDPIDQSVVDSYSYAAMSHCHVKYTKRLIRKLQEIRERFQERADWPHRGQLISNVELRCASNRISPNAVAQLSLANPWPTREMGGIDVLVEDTFPFDPKNFVEVPQPKKNPITHTPTILVQQRFLSLWIINKPMSKDVETLVDTVRNLPKETFIELAVVHTIEQAMEWMSVNRKSLQTPGTSFKVVLAWSLINSMIAVDFIRAVRAKESHVPVLIFTNKREEIQAALQFSNVTATDMPFDLYEFVGVNQETQWNTGCRVVYPHCNPTSPEKPLLWWIDCEEEVTRAVEQLWTNYPQLEIRFTPTFKEAQVYLKDHAEDIRLRRKKVVICRGRYFKESKNVMDVVHLLKEFSLDVPLGVYTRDRVGLKKKLPNIPKHVHVFDKLQDPLSFVQEKLNL